MRRLLVILVALAALGAVAFWLATRPHVLAASALDGLSPDLERGEYVFHAAGCASCHSAEGATGDDLLKLGGGRTFPSPFGTFHAPNISPDARFGIGGWSDIQFVNAIMMGVGPGGEHLYPALPYPAYRHMTLQDAVSLHAYISTLPPVATPSEPHELGFPFSIRRFVGVWKLLNLKPGWAVDPVPEDAVTGRYIAEALGHCGECHTPRTMMGGLKRGEWLGGAPNPAGKGNIPNITPGKLDWSQNDLAGFFKTGFTPDFDQAGGSMAEVIQNLSTLPAADLESLAKYLAAVPPHP